MIIFSDFAFVLARAMKPGFDMDIAIDFLLTNNISSEVPRIVVETRNRLAALNWE